MGVYIPLPLPRCHNVGTIHRTHTLHTHTHTHTHTSLSSCHLLLFSFPLFCTFASRGDRGNEDVQRLQYSGLHLHPRRRTLRAHEVVTANQVQDMLGVRRRVERVLHRVSVRPLDRGGPADALISCRRPTKRGKEGLAVRGVGVAEDKNVDGVRGAKGAREERQEREDGHSSEWEEPCRNGDGGCGRRVE